MPDNRNEFTQEELAALQQGAGQIDPRQLDEINRRRQAVTESRRQQSQIRGRGPTRGEVRVIPSPTPPPPVAELPGPQPAAAAPPEYAPGEAGYGARLKDIMVTPDAWIKKAEKPHPSQIPMEAISPQIRDALGVPVGQALKTNMLSNDNLAMIRDLAVRNTWQTDAKGRQVAVGDPSPSVAQLFVQMELQRRNKLAEQIAALHAMGLSKEADKLAKDSGAERW